MEEDIKKMFPTSIRLSDRSLKQLKFLQKRFGENRTITLTRVIAEAYINEIKVKREKIAREFDQLGYGSTEIV